MNSFQIIFTLWCHKKISVFGIGGDLIYESLALNKKLHKHTGDTDFVSDFGGDYFAFCTCAEGTSCLHFSHFV